MPRSVLMLGLALGLLLAPARNAAAADSGVVAFENVNVIPMDRERILERQTVIVRQGRLAEIGPAGKVKAPPDALRVAGAGKYLMPGLAEMHAHLPGPNTPPQVLETVLFLFVANGILTARGMQGHPNQLEVRSRAAEGKLLSPTLFLAGPALGGQSASSAETAARMVREQKAAGFDLLKVHEGLTREVYDAIAATAAEVKIPFGGHVSQLVGLRRAIEVRQSSIDHLDNFIDELEADDSPIRNADAPTRAQRLPFHLDERKLPELAAATRKAGIYVVPTMALWEIFSTDEKPESLAKRPELKYVPRQWVEQWVKTKTGMLEKNPSPEAGRRVIEVRKRILKALRDAGVKILLGTDAPQLFSVPGFSIHRETPIMVAAGLSPYDVLAAGTRNVAEYFGALDQFGTLETGKRADLLLLEANPLKDVAHLARRAGVMVRGRWLPEAEIQQRLAAIASGPP